MNSLEIAARVLWLLIALNILSAYFIQRIAWDLRKIVKFIEGKESDNAKKTAPIFKNTFSKQREAQIISSLNENSVKVRVVTNDNGLRTYYLSDVDEGKKPITWDELIVHYTNAEDH